jgi:hypothetical protein
MTTERENQSFNNGRQAGCTETLNLLLDEQKITLQVYDEMIMRLSNVNIRKNRERSS